MTSKKVVLISALLSVSLLSAQDFQTIVKNEIARKGFSDFDSSLCNKTIRIQMSERRAEVLSSTEHFVNKVDSEHYNIEFIGGSSIWYKIEAVSSRDLNFSLFPLNMQNFNFVLYKVQNYTRNTCPKTEQLEISRAVLVESADLLKGVGLTGESTADYNDSKNLNNILYATPYHKSVYLENQDVYLLNVLAQSEDVSHTLSIANTVITLNRKKNVESEFKKTNLKSFLNKSKNISTSNPKDSSDLTSTTAPETSFEPLKEKTTAVNNYDHFLYEPAKDPNAPVVKNKPKKTKKKQEMSEAEVFAMENPKEAKNSKKQNQETSSSALPQSLYSPNNINGKLVYSDGSPATNVSIYITDVTTHTDHRMVGVKTTSDGSFSIPAIADHVFISADADDVKKGNKTPLKISGTLPSSKKNTKIYSAKVEGETFEINNVTLVAYDDQALVPSSARGYSQNGSLSSNTTSKSAHNSSTNGAFVYKIQVGAYKRTRSFKRSKFSSYGNIESYNLGDGLTRYTVGYYTSLDEAERMKQSMINDGHTGVFIVGFKNGIRTQFR